MTVWQQLKDCVQGDHPFVAHAHAIVDKMKAEEEQWIEDLRKQGFKAAHPNDGWVDRERKEVHLQYPQFNDGVKQGDRIMLGWASQPDKNVAVVITAIRRSSGFSDMTYYGYKEENPDEHA